MLILNATLLVAWVVALLFTVSFSVTTQLDHSTISAARTAAGLIKRNSIFAETTTPANQAETIETTTTRDLENEPTESISVGEEAKVEKQVETSLSSSASVPSSVSSPEVVSSSVSSPAVVSSASVASESSTLPEPSATSTLPETLPEPTTSTVVVGHLPTESEGDDISEEEWKDKVCSGIPDSVCHEVFIVKSRQATFCSAAKVASTTTKQYFFDISENELKIPEDARFGVHEANWVRFGNLDQVGRKWVLENKDWTHVFFWKHVLERFVSGYLDKVVTDCKKDPTDKPHLAIHHYIQYGFTCEEHEDLEAFVNFMETVPKVEGHFAPQTPLCNLKRFPYTDMVRADEHLNTRLKNISSKLGVEHPEENKKTSKHKTGAKEKMVNIFKDKPFLIQKILSMFKEDCERIPDACNVDEIMAAIEAPVATS